MYLLKTEEKDEVLKTVIGGIKTWGHHFGIHEAGPGGLRQARCVHCGRTIFVNKHGVSFGSALREDCHGA